MSEAIVIIWHALPQREATCCRVCCRGSLLPSQLLDVVRVIWCYVVLVLECSLDLSREKLRSLMISLPVLARTGFRPGANPS